MDPAKSNLPHPGAVNYRDDAVAVLRRLRDAGFTAYFAGGCVRDELLGLEPKDYDVATDAPPDKVRDIFRNTQAVGAAFGVILVRQGPSVIEVATFRRDLEYHDGRRPDGVQFTTAEEDARRRDFTVNGLFLDPIENRVIDFVNGQADLQQKILRAIGSPAERFAEDHLRLLRAVRFAARFGFEIDSQTARAIRENAHLLPRISPERIGEEMRRMLTPVTRRIASRLLWEMELTGIVFRFVRAEGNETPDANRSIFISLPGKGAISFGAALAAASLDFLWQRGGRPVDLRQWLAKEQVSKIVRAMRQGLKISNEESSELEGVLHGTALLLAEPAPGVAGMKRFLANATADASRHLLDALAAMGLYLERIDKVRTALAELETTDFAPLPLITGDDLTAAGAQPGPGFKRALDGVYDAQLDGRISTKEHAMELGLRILNSRSS